MGQTITKSVDRIEKSITTTLDSSITPSTVDLNQRLHKCFISFHQFLQDVKRLNLNYTKLFIHNNNVIKFQIHSKLPADQLASKWKYSDNCIVTATEIPIQNNNNSDEGPSHVLTLREFYYLFLYMCDNYSNLSLARERLRQIQNPDETKSNTTQPSDNECSICLSNEVEIALVCLHSFCKACIVDWNTNSTECPVCRSVVDVKGDDNWDLVSNNNEEEIKEQIHSTALFVHDYCRKRPIFQKKKKSHSLIANSQINPNPGTPSKPLMINSNNNNHNNIPETTHNSSQIAESIPANASNSNSISPSIDSSAASISSQPSNSIGQNNVNSIIPNNSNSSL